MLKAFGACPRYVQGPGAVDKLAEIARGLGERPTVVIDSHVLDILQHRLRPILEELKADIVPFRAR